MIKYSDKKVIDIGDWDDLVTETYNKPYNFQQQDGCKDRGIFNITIPQECDDSSWPEKIPEKVNGEIMGVRFEAWLSRNPDEHKFENNWQNELFWDRNFYPDVQMVANDLCKKGLIEPGDYIINIDW